MRWLEALLFRWPDGQPVDVDALGELQSRTALAQVVLRVVGSPDGRRHRLDEDLLADMAAAEVARLGRRGIGPPLIGAVGDLDGIPAEVSRLPGGFASLERVADEQIALRRQRRVPTVEFDAAWTVPVAGEDPLLERVEETLCALADTRFGTRGAVEEERPGADPLVVAAGRYVAGSGEGTEATPTLLAGPLWTSLALSDGGEVDAQRWLDLSAGLLVREGPRLRSVRFMSLATPGRCVLRAEAPAGMLVPGPDLAVPASVERGHVVDVGPSTVAVSESTEGWLAAAARTETSRTDHLQTIERHVLLADGSGDPFSDGQVQQLADHLDGMSFEELLRQQREAWARRWDRASISIEGDPDLELAVRFGLFHLISSVADRGEAAVGARGLSGAAYRGHVFWDADVFVLPFLAATHPSAARAMLAYRHARLDAASRAASAEGHGGARFPWESADDGTDVTPRFAIGVDGAVVPILTGQYQEHITADVAWAVAHYLDWTGDGDFERGAGRDLLLETARYWPSRIEREAEGRAHLRRVMGPDEYHGPVDDNVFTNGMARFNLRRAAALVGAADPATLRREAMDWRTLAADLVDGYRPELGRHEQFAGFDDLDALLIDEVAAPPVAADVLLGAERTAASQIIKQADVLMLHHLVPEQLPAGSLPLDLAYYLPRTAHGSSLSPGIHAALLARAGQVEEALRWFRLAARLDLDDRTGTTAGGLHLAALGSVWQALAFGFVGVRPGSTSLTVDPHLPRSWTSVEVRVTFRGVALRIRAAHEYLDVEADGATEIRLGGHPRRFGPGIARFVKQADGWRRREDVSWT